MLSLEQILALPKPARRRVAQVLAAQPTSVAAIGSIARPDPGDFITQVLGARPTAAAIKAGYTVPWTPDQGRVLESVRDKRKTAVAAGVGVGKTRVAAWLALWFLYSRVPSKVITTAPTWLQVEKLLWKEIGAAWASSLLALPGKLLTTEIQLTSEHFALGLSTRTDVGDISATKFQGFHSPNVLVVLDEATGIAEEMWEGAEGLALRPGDRILAIGNPTDPGSRFKRTFDLGAWAGMTIDCRNHPNVLKGDPDIIPGAVTKEWIEEKLEEYGSAEAPLFVAKVAGRFPDQASDALISLAWIAGAQKKWTRTMLEQANGLHVSDNKGIALGLDVAGEGEDLTNLWAIEEGCAFMPVIQGKPAWHVGRDVMQAASLVVQAIKSMPSEDGFHDKDGSPYTRVHVVAFDDTGLGQAVGARLRELQQQKKLPRFLRKGDREPCQVQILSINFGASAHQNERFADLKDELWWNGRETLRAGTLGLPPETEIAKYGLPRGNNLYAQLAAPFYAADSSGRILVFDKRGARGGGTDEKTRERVRNLPAKSPDLAHALLLARHAWATLRPDVGKERPATTEDVFTQQMRALMAKRNQNKKHEIRAYKGRNWSGR